MFRNLYIYSYMLGEKYREEKGWKVENKEGVREYSFN